MKKLIFLLSVAVTMAAETMAQTSATWTADNGNGTFTNPLFYDEFSDPDIIRVGEDYYLAGTTMHAVPGLVILHSKDLVNWENVSYCFNRFDFDDPAFSLKDGKEVYGQGIWAPCIRHHNGKFYIY
ncbi:MAG: family 43 glycosylhydrolase, partial [Bacteroidaceae bacterium]|nr:family 43 glycosylhydrolase [Bacteroidaceae bacterium]